MLKRGTGKVAIKCGYCRKVFLAFKCYLPRRKFCSKKCRNKAHGKYFNGLNLGGALVKLCLNCGKEIKTYKSINAKTCSRKCAGSVHSKKFANEKHPGWRGGRKNEEWRIRNRREWLATAKQVRKRDKSICQECDYNGNEVHHIIPYRISKNNSLDNLQTLCKSCHRKKDAKYQRQERMAIGVH